jgi:hypothetical protein
LNLILIKFVWLGRVKKKILVLQKQSIFGQLFAQKGFLAKLLTKLKFYSWKIFFLDFSKMVFFFISAKIVILNRYFKLIKKKSRYHCNFIKNDFATRLKIILHYLKMFNISLWLVTQTLAVTIFDTL